jgi:hypothetical protein
MALVAALGDGLDARTADEAACGTTLVLAALAERGAARTPETTAVATVMAVLLRGRYDMGFFLWDVTIRPDETE